MRNLRRRDFIALLSGVTAWPLSSRADQPGRMRRIAALIGGVAEFEPESRARVAVLRKALEERGWSESSNLQIDFRWAGSDDPDRIHALAAELVATNPDVIFANTSPVTRALSRTTRSVPVVFTSVSDPVGDGIVASFARPGGNITGFTNVDSSIGGKWLEILKELAPTVTRAGFMFNPPTAPGGGSFFLPSFEEAARTLDVQPIAIPVADIDGVERALDSLVVGANAGLIINSDTFAARHRAAIISAVARHRMPAVYPFVFFVTEGGLAGYGTDVKDLWRRAASYLDRILRGEKPADLPVQAPTKFELAVNLKTASALGLAVPPSLIARADEVIE